jgi:aspartate racemase
MVRAALNLERGGADMILIGANTMHKSAPQIEANVHIPLLHIADATAQRILAQGLTRIGLLGTRYTMEEDFYKGRLTQKFGLDVIVPPAAQRELVNQVIFNELCLGKILPGSRAAYREIMQDLVKQGAQGIILGCTEIGLLVKPEDSPVPTFDTTRIHAEQAVAFALAD